MSVLLTNAYSKSFLEVKTIFMNEISKLVFGLFLPLIGTTAGATTVLFMKKSQGSAIQKALTGIASGVMLAASVWSLLIPSIEAAEASPLPSWLPATAGLLFGVLFLMLLDGTVSFFKKAQNTAELREAKTFLMFLAVTLHNIPEGMAVGVVLSGFVQKTVFVSEAEAFALIFGIAIQNFPEGAMISMPMAANGRAKKKSFILGFLSGAVEPVAAALTLVITSFVSSALPFVLSFAAGAMIYVVTADLIPEAHSGPHSKTATICVAIGFAIMMILDISLG